MCKITTNLCCVSLVRISQKIQNIFILNVITTHKVVIKADKNMSRHKINLYRHLSIDMQIK